MKLCDVDFPNIKFGDHVISNIGNSGRIVHIDKGLDMDRKLVDCIWIFWDNQHDRFDNRLSHVAHRDAQRIEYVGREI